MCILSPVLLIFFGGLSDQIGAQQISEGMAVGIGIAAVIRKAK